MPYSTTSTHASAQQPIVVAVAPPQGMMTWARSYRADRRRGKRSKPLIHEELVTYCVETGHATALISLAALPCRYSGAAAAQRRRRARHRGAATLPLAAVAPSQRHSKARYPLEAVTALAYFRQGKHARLRCYCRHKPHGGMKRPRGDLSVSKAPRRRDQNQAAAAAGARQQARTNESRSAAVRHSHASRPVLLAAGAHLERIMFSLPVRHRAGRTKAAAAPPARRITAPLRI